MVDLVIQEGKVNVSMVLQHGIHGTAIPQQYEAAGLQLLRF